MSFVEPKSAEKLALSMMMRTRNQLIDHRTATVNALRGHMAEFGLIVPVGIKNIVSQRRRKIHWKSYFSPKYTMKDLQGHDPFTIENRKKSMTDTPDTNGTPTGEASSAKLRSKSSSRILAQYIRDLSFENMFAQNDFASDSAPEISVQVTLNTRKRSGKNQHEVITKLVASSKSKGEGKPLFLLELEYAGVFEVANMSEDQLSAFLLIECPQLTFPFVRRLALDITRDGGFPPLNLDKIDFHEMYVVEAKRRSDVSPRA